MLVLSRLKEKFCRIAPDKVTIGPLSWNLRERICSKAEESNKVMICIIDPLENKVYCKFVPEVKLKKYYHQLREPTKK